MDREYGSIFLDNGEIVKGDIKVHEEDAGTFFGVPSAKILYLEVRTDEGERVFINWEKIKYVVLHGMKR